MTFVHEVIKLLKLITYCISRVAFNLQNKGLANSGLMPINIIHIDVKLYL